MTMQPAYTYRATIPRIVDGDTYVINADLGFRVSFEFHGRLHGANAPELTTPEGKAAKQYVMANISPITPVLVQSYKDEKSFERWIVDIWLPDGTSLADLLIQTGHAVPMNP